MPQFSKTFETINLTFSLVYILSLLASFTRSIPSYINIELTITYEVCYLLAVKMLLQGLNKVPLHFKSFAAFDNLLFTKTHDAWCN